MPTTAEEHAVIEFTLKELTEIRRTAVEAESRLTALSDQPWFTTIATALFGRSTTVDEARADTYRAIQKLAHEMRENPRSQRLDELWTATLDAAHVWQRAAE